MTSNKIITAAIRLSNTMAETEMTVDRIRPSAAAATWLCFHSSCKQKAVSLPTGRSSEAVLTH